MSSQFWTRTVAAIAMAVLPVGLYYLVQSVPSFATGANLLAIVILLFGSILALIAWVGQNTNLEPATAE